MPLTRASSGREGEHTKEGTKGHMKLDGAGTNSDVPDLGRQSGWPELHVLEY